MTREEFRALVWDILGLHATKDKVDTVMLAADSYAAASAAGALRPIPAGGAT